MYIFILFLMYLLYIYVGCSYCLLRLRKIVELLLWECLIMLMLKYWSIVLMMVI